jgi:hypothetical protein
MRSMQKIKRGVQEHSMDPLLVQSWLRALKGLASSSSHVPPSSFAAVAGRIQPLEYQLNGLMSKQSCEEALARVRRLVERRADEEGNSATVNESVVASAEAKVSGEVYADWSQSLEQREAVSMTAAEELRAAILQLHDWVQGCRHDTMREHVSSTGGLGLMNADPTEAKMKALAAEAAEGRKKDALDRFDINTQTLALLHERSFPRDEAAEASATATGATTASSRNAGTASVGDMLSVLEHAEESFKVLADTINGSPANVIACVEQLALELAPCLPQQELNGGVRVLHVKHEAEAEAEKPTPQVYRKRSRDEMASQRVEIAKVVAANAQGGAQVAGSVPPPRKKETKEPGSVLHIDIISATGLVGADSALFAKWAKAKKDRNDAYCKVKVDGTQVGKTNVIQNNNSPVWDVDNIDGTGKRNGFDLNIDLAKHNYSSKFDPLGAAFSLVTIECWEYDLASMDEFLGHVSLPLAVLTDVATSEAGEAGKEHEKTFEMVPLDGLASTYVGGTLKLRMYWQSQTWISQMTAAAGKLREVEAALAKQKAKQYTVIHIDVLACVGLKKADTFSKNDTYLRLQLINPGTNIAQWQKKTSVVSGTLSPQWAEGLESFDLQIDKEDAAASKIALRVAVLERDGISKDDFLGEVVFTGPELLKFTKVEAAKSKSVSPKVLELEKNAAQSAKYVKGQVELRLWQHKQADEGEMKQMRRRASLNSQHQADAAVAAALAAAAANNLEDARALQAQAAAAEVQKRCARLGVEAQVENSDTWKSATSGLLNVTPAMRAQLEAKKAELAACATNIAELESREQNTMQHDLSPWQQYEANVESACGVKGKDKVLAEIPVFEVLHLEIIKASNTKQADGPLDKNDCFCKVLLDGLVVPGSHNGKTRVILNKNSPIWDEGDASFDIVLSPPANQPIAEGAKLAALPKIHPDSVLTIEVWDKDNLTKDEFLGQAVYTGAELEQVLVHNPKGGSRLQRIEQKLQTHPKFSAKYVQGTLAVLMHRLSPEGAPFNGMCETKTEHVKQKVAEAKDSGLGKLKIAREKHVFLTTELRELEQAAINGAAAADSGGSAAAAATGGSSNDVHAVCVRLVGATGIGEPPSSFLDQDSGGHADSARHLNTSEFECCVRVQCLGQTKYTTPVGKSTGGLAAARVTSGVGGAGANAHPDRVWEEEVIFSGTSGAPPDVELTLVPVRHGHSVEQGLASKIDLGSVSLTIPAARWNSDTDDLGTSHTLELGGANGKGTLEVMMLTKRMHPTHAPDALRRMTLMSQPSARGGALLSSAPTRQSTIAPVLGVTPMGKVSGYSGAGTISEDAQSLAELDVTIPAYEVGEYTLSLPAGPLGLQFTKCIHGGAAGGMVVVKAVSGTAAQTQKIVPGHCLTHIAGTAIKGRSFKEAMQLLTDAKRPVELAFCRVNPDATRRWAALEKTSVNAVCRVSLGGTKGGAHKPLGLSFRQAPGQNLSAVIDSVMGEAAAAGLQPGWFLLSINNHDTSNIDFATTQHLLALSERPLHLMLYTGGNAATVPQNAATSAAIGTGLGTPAPIITSAPAKNNTRKVRYGVTLGGTADAPTPIGLELVQGGAADRSATVKTVAKGSEAEKCGQMKAGDLLVGVNGDATDTLTYDASMRMLIAAKRPLRLEFEREVDMGNLMPTEQVAAAPAATTLAAGGEARMELTITGSGALGVVMEKSSTGAAQVQELDPASAALQQGVKPGDVLVEVNGQSMQGLTFVQSLMAVKQAPRPLSLVFQGARADAAAPAPSMKEAEAAAAGRGSARKKTGVMATRVSSNDLVNGTSFPGAAPKEAGVVEVSWDGQISLGLELVENESGGGGGKVLVKSRAPTSLLTNVNPGMLIRSVNGQDVRETIFLEVMQLLRSAARPTLIAFSPDPAAAETIQLAAPAAPAPAKTVVDRVAAAQSVAAPLMASTYPTAVVDWCGKQSLGLELVENSLPNRADIQAKGFVLAPVKEGGGVLVKSMALTSPVKEQIRCGMVIVSVAGNDVSSTAFLDTMQLLQRSPRPTAIIFAMSPTASAGAAAAAASANGKPPSSVSKSDSWKDRIPDAPRTRSRSLGEEEWHSTMAVSVVWDGVASLGLELVEKKGVPGHAGAVIKGIAPAGIVSTGGDAARLKEGMMIVNVNNEDTRSMAFIDLMQLLRRAVSTPLYCRVLLHIAYLLSIHPKLTLVSPFMRSRAQRASASAPLGPCTSTTSHSVLVRLASASRTTVLLPAVRWCRLPPPRSRWCRRRRRSQAR